MIKTKRRNPIGTNPRRNQAIRDVRAMLPGGGGSGNSALNMLEQREAGDARINYRGTETMDDGPELNIDLGQRSRPQERYEAQTAAVPRKPTGPERFFLGDAGANDAVQREADVEQRRIDAAEINRRSAAGSRLGSLVANAPRMQGGEYPGGIHLDDLTEDDALGTKPYQDLARDVDPEAYLSKIMQTVNPPPPQPIDADKRLVQMIKGKPTVVLESAPKIQDKYEVLTDQQSADLGLPKGGSYKRNVTTGDIAAVVQPSREKGPDQFEVLTEDQAKDIGLPTGGTFKRNKTTGDVTAVVQPKQDAPTESQSRYAFNARRITSALNAINAQLKEDPSAITSTALSVADAFSLVPGAEAMGRKAANPRAQIVRNNFGDAIDAAITLATGAAYTKEQLVAARNSLMPQVGEPPEVQADKFRQWNEIYDQARANARSAGVELPDISSFDAIFKPKPAAPSAARQPVVGGSLPPGVISIKRIGD